MASMALSRFTLRDLLWLVVVVGLAIALLIANDRAIDSESAYKVWAFDIAAKILKEKTGVEMRVTNQGIVVRHPDGTVHGYSHSATVP
jgi:hypothetical protein